MPIPKPKPKETRADFIGRCMGAIGGEYDDNDQAVAVCESTWRESKKDMSRSRNDELIAAVRTRQKQTEFNYGILTADAYARTLRECVGSDICYRYASTRSTSFDDILRKAANTLTYGNPEMVVEEASELGINLEDKATDVYAEGKLPDGIELPKNTLMVFRHVLTTPRKDRDGDILRTQGAEVDPKMLLLWQHVHTLPIGKYLGTDVHTSKKLSVYSAIVDMNELSHDAAVMVDNDMGRFSHGFRAIDFDNLKEEGSGRTSGKGGFDVKRFEIMEESLVSVPSNIGADTEEIILSLVDRKQLKSPLMRAAGLRIREKAMSRATTVPVKLDVQLLVNGKSIDHEERGLGSAEGGGEKGCSCGGAPEEADGNGEAADGKKKPDDKEMMTCKKCGGKMVGGICEKCGYDMNKAKKPPKDDGDGECPECGAPMEDGVCPDCGYTAKKDAVGQDNADANNDMGVVLCQNCGTVALVDGKCPVCGATPKDVPKSTSGMTKGYVSGSSINGSWENIQSSLYERAVAFAKSTGIGFAPDDAGRTPYIYTLATFDGSAILALNQTDGSTSYYRAEWKMMDGEPKFVGTLKEIRIEVSAKIIEKAKKMAGIRAGRVLSSKNRTALSGVRDGIQELHDKELIMSKGGRAICRDSVKTLGEVIKSADPPEEVSTSDLTAKDAMAEFLAKATTAERGIMMKTLETFATIDKRAASTKEIRALVGR